MKAKETTAYKCKNCGGEVRFDIKAQRFLCASCKTEYAANADGTAVFEKDFHTQSMLVSSTELSGVTKVVCDGCGGEIFFNDRETAARCPMCGSSKLREDAGSAIIKPDGVVPFKVDAHDAQESFRKYLKKRLYAPNKLKKAFEEGKLEGCYIPFWTFDADAHGDYTAEGGNTVTETKPDGTTVSKTEWTRVSGDVHESFDDLLIPATRNISDKLSVSSGYQTRDVKPFTTQYLQGYLSEYRSIESGEAFKQARAIMYSSLRSKAESDVRSDGYSDIRALVLNAIYKNITCKSLLLPLYRAAYSYNGKLYDYIINGQTGKVDARYPKSAWKIILTIFIIAAVIAGIALLASLA